MNTWSCPAGVLHVRRQALSAGGRFEEKDGPYPRCLDGLLHTSRLGPVTALCALLNKGLLTRIRRMRRVPNRAPCICHLPRTLPVCYRLGWPECGTKTYDYVLLPASSGLGWA